MQVKSHKHLKQRIRVREVDTEQLRRALEQLNQKLKQEHIRRHYGRVEWYYPVISGKEVQFYIVGKGTAVASVLTADMIPYGKELR